MVWNPFQTPIDYILIAGTRSPGIAKITTPPKTLFKWEEKSGRGSSGSHLVYTGQGVATIDVTLEFYDEADFEGWDVFKMLLGPPVTSSRSSTGGGGESILTPETTSTVTTSKAIEVWHPQLIDRGITSVVVSEVGAPEPLDETGVWGVKFQLKQYTPPAPSYSKTDGSDSTTTAQQELDDPFDREARALTQQLEELSQRRRRQ